MVYVSGTGPFALSLALTSILDQFLVLAIPYLNKKPKGPSKVLQWTLCRKTSAGSAKQTRLAGPPAIKPGQFAPERG